MVSAHAGTKALQDALRTKMLERLKIALGRVTESGDPPGDYLQLFERTMSEYAELTRLEGMPAPPDIMLQEHMRTATYRDDGRPQPLIDPRLSELYDDLQMQTRVTAIVATQRDQLRQLMYKQNAIWERTVQLGIFAFGVSVLCVLWVGTMLGLWGGGVGWWGVGCALMVGVGYKAVQSYRRRMDEWARRLSYSGSRSDAAEGD